MFSRIFPFLNSLARPIRIGELEPVPHKPAFLVLGIVIYVVTQLLFNSYVMHDRTLAYDPSDAYTYIVKAEQMEEGCFMQDCAAIKTLQSQLEGNTQNADLDWLRYRAYARVSLVYHPLHSVILAGLHATGLSWETAYQILLTAGVILIGLGAGMLAQSLFGSNAALLTLLVLSFSQFQGQGLHLVVPSNISLGLMMLAWAVVITRREKSYWVFFALIIAMVTMHSAGRIYALLSLGVFFLMDRRAIDWKTIAGYAVLFAPIAAFFVLPQLVSKPVLGLPPEPGGEMTYSEGIYNNVRQAFSIITLWDGRANFVGAKAGNFSGNLLALTLSLLALAGIFLLARSRRKLLLLLSTGIAALCMASMFLVLPHYPAELFSRVWCVVALIISGSACYAITNLTKVPRLESRKVRALLACFFGAVILVHAVYGTKAIYKMGELIKNIENVAFAQSQEKYIAENCGTVLYTSETNLLYFLTQNGLDCPSVYLPGLASREDGVKRLKDMPSPYLVVIDQPGQETMTLKKQSSINILLDNYEGPGQFFLKFGGEVSGLEIGILINDEPFTIRADAGQWVALSKAVRKGDKVVIPGKFSAPVYLQGLRVGNAPAKADWPWGKRIVLTYKTRVTEGYNFSFQDQTKSIFNKFDIIDSKGSSMLLKASAE